MNLILRMLWVWFLSLRRERLPVGVAETRLRLITLPNDLDLNLHMNNGRYLTMADLSRIDLFLRTGLVSVMRKEKWAPIISEHTMIYKRSLRLFQKFEAVMQLTHWDDRCFYMSHQFLVGERVVAEGTSVGVIRGRDGVIAPERVLDRLRVERGLA
ncbi:thioesterase family protein [Variovorax humicola]|uniref:Thioesterase family protein n=1 Tax=Variovorax humicola TaxID=1769758 RepID=A0ABU8W832_9BURK